MLKKITAQSIKTSLLIVCLLGCMAAPAQAQTTADINSVAATVRYVSPAGTDAGNNCDVLASPCGSIQRAVNVSADGDEIRVAQGTYVDTVTTADAFITGTVILSRSVSLLGGYAGNFSSRNPGAFITTIDSQLQQKSGVVVLGTRSMVDGFSIINGRAQHGSGVNIATYLGQTPVITLSNNLISQNSTQPTPSSDGAGVYASGIATVNILNNRIFSNAVEGGNTAYGAGIVLRGGVTALVQGNVISGNTSNPATGGGGLLIYLSTVQVLSNTFANNSSDAIAIFDSFLTRINGNQFVDNTSATVGGGLYLAGTTRFEITNNAFSRNKAVGFTGGGIAIVDAARGLIQRNTFSANMAGTGGGGIAADTTGDTLNVSNNMFEGNTAAFGGGIYISTLPSATLTLNANILRNNFATSANQAGGIYVQNVGKPITLTNNVIVGNSNRGIYGYSLAGIQLINNTLVGNGGRGLELAGDATAPPTLAPSAAYSISLSNNIIVNHTECGLSYYNTGGVATTNYNLVSNTVNFCALTLLTLNTNKFNIDPQFIDAPAGDFHLKATSPAKDTGTLTDAPKLDYGGGIRPKGSGADMGAYEFGTDFKIYTPMVMK